MLLYMLGEIILVVLDSNFVYDCPFKVYCHKAVIEELQRIIDDSEVQTKYINLVIGLQKLYP